MTDTPKRVLLVEDNSDNRRIYRYYLRHLDDIAEFEEVGDGVQALRSLQAQRPDLVLLDLVMPEMNGWETLREIRRLERGPRIPVIVMSAYVGHDAWTDPRRQLDAEDAFSVPVRDAGAFAASVGRHLGLPPTTA